MSTPKPETRAAHLAMRCHKKAIESRWAGHVAPDVKGGTGWMIYYFDLPTAGQGPFYSFILLNMRFLVERHTKHDKVLEWEASVPGLGGGMPVAVLERPESLERTLEWASMVAAMYEASNPITIEVY